MRTRSFPTTSSIARARLLRAQGTVWRGLHWRQVGRHGGALLCQDGRRHGSPRHALRGPLFSRFMDAVALRDAQVWSTDPYLVAWRSLTGACTRFHKLESSRRCILDCMMCPTAEEHPPEATCPRGNASAVASCCRVSREPCLGGVRPGTCSMATGSCPRTHLAARSKQARVRPGPRRRVTCSTARRPRRLLPIWTRPRPPTRPRSAGARGFTIKSSGLATCRARLAGWAWYDF